ncbi:alpha/beta hydrolase [Paenibacillus sp. GCM10012303]|uniref:alpha/beta hydrolase n=1 Tax=Paenibacillus sp. GCM10012303 TaxID=3317340 RepID=UPI00360B25EB
MNVNDLEHGKLGIYDVKDQLKRHVYSRSAEAFAAGDRARDEVVTLEQLERRKSRMRSAFIQSLGGLPPSDCPLDPILTGTLQRDGYTIDKVIFQSRPNHWVTANLYIPAGTGAPSAAVLHLCGHNPMAKQGDVYQIVSQHLVRAGLIVLTIDPIGQGERLSYYDRDTSDTRVAASTREHEYAGRQSLPLGDCSARYFLHDAMRAVDYLCTRPEVDPAKIGVTGCSGGGMQTSMMMLCDPRIAAAAPAAFIMNRESYMYAGQAQDAEQIWPGLTKLGFDHEDLLMAMAPRPALVLAAEYDFFPIEGTRRTVERTRRFWDMYGSCGEAGLEYFEDACVHTYSPPMAKAAAVFFSKHLLGKPPVCSWEGIQPISPELLGCTKSGQLRGDRGDAHAIHEANCGRLALLEEASTAMPEPARKERALVWLRERVYGGRSPCPLNPRRAVLGKLDEELSVERILWWSQTSLFNHGLLFRSSECAGPASSVTIGLWARGTKSIGPRLRWIRETCKAGRAVFVLDVSGDGAVMPNGVTAAGGMHDFFGTVHKFVTDLYWLDDSLAALRTFDVVRALDLVESLSGGENPDIRLYADGRFGMYAALAAILDDRLKQVETVNGISSIADFVRSREYDPLDSEGIILPGILRYFDMPDIERWRSGRH